MGRIHRQILTAIVLICIVHHISALNFCSCNNGVDVCNGDCECNQRPAPRREVGPQPKPVQRPKPTLFPFPTIKICTEPAPTLPTYKPIGDDVCGCNKNSVTPAPRESAPCPCAIKWPTLDELFKPKCDCAACSPGSTSEKPCTRQTTRKPCTRTTRRSHKCTKCSESSNANRKVKVPRPSSSSSESSADPVSIAIAQRAANRAKYSVSEQTLSFGSLNKPIIRTQNNDNEKSPITDEDEDQLYASRGRVLELRRDPFEPKNLKFDQVGYRNYQARDPKYVVVRQRSQKSDSSSSS